MVNSNRRVFLSTVTAGTLALSQSIRSVAQDRKIQIGVIGVGWYGMVDAKAALNVGGTEIAAICDVDRDHLQKSADELETLQGKRPQTYKLYQELLEQNGLDVVIIATPPHWHALIFLATLEKSLDIYCEKPLAYDIREGCAMVEAARNKSNIVQIGFQRRQSQAFRDVKQFIDEGKAGAIVQVDAQIHYNAVGGLKDPTPQDPPAGFDWDLWCGPGPKIPFSPQVGHFNWRLEKTSGHGHLVDWGIHLIDATRMILGLTTPKKVTAAGGIYTLKGKITTPDILTVHFEFDRCPVVWRHRLWGAEEFDPSTNNGIFFYGEKATIFATDNRWVVIPAGKNSERQEMNIETDTGLNHMKDFLEAVRNRHSPSCLIQDGFQSTATVQLGMIAYESDSTIQWDETTASISNPPDATALLKREYRDPWKHPFRN